MRMRQKLMRRAQRLLPRQIEATGLLPIASPAQWQNSALAALPLPSMPGLLPLRMHAHTAAALMAAGLVFLREACNARAALPGVERPRAYQPWRSLADADVALLPELLRQRLADGSERAVGAFTVSRDGRHRLWLLPASAEIWLGWCD